MEKLALNGSTEKIKENISTVSKKSKETIRGIIDASSSQLENALDANKEFIQTMEKQFVNQDFLDTSLMSELNKTFGDSVNLSEEAIDTIIDIQTAQLQSAIDLNIRLMNSIKDIDFNNTQQRDELVGLIEKSVNDSTKILTDNTKKMTDIYNKHLNLALNFSDKFARNLDKRLQLLNKFQARNMDMFNDWASQWWKTSTNEASV